MSCGVRYSLDDRPGLVVLPSHNFRAILAACMRWLVNVVTSCMRVPFKIAAQQAAEKGEANMSTKQLRSWEPWSASCDARKAAHCHTIAAAPRSLQLPGYWSPKERSATLMPGHLSACLCYQALLPINSPALHYSLACLNAPHARSGACESSQRAKKSLLWAPLSSGAPVASPAAQRAHGRRGRGGARQHAHSRRGGQAGLEARRRLAIQRAHCRGQRLRALAQRLLRRHQRLRGAPDTHLVTSFW